MKRSSLCIALMIMVLAGVSLSRWSVPQADNPAGGNDPTRPATAPLPGRGPGLLVKGSEAPRKSPRDLQIGEAQPGPGGAPSLFNSVAGPSRTADRQRPQPASILNRRAIGVNWDALHELRKSGTGTLEIDTGSGLLAARVGEVIENPGGGYSLAGGIAGDPLGTFLATVHEDALVASITTGTGLPRRFAISPVAAGEHEFQEVDPTLAPVCGGALIPPPGPEGDAAEEDGPKGESGKGPRSHHKDNHQPIIDIMIVYTSAAKDDRGGEAAMQAAANQAINWTNIAFSNSRVRLAFRLVHTGVVRYSESGDSLMDLQRLQGTSDGYLDEVHALRDAYRADIVSLWCLGQGWGNVGGRGYEMPENNAGWDRYTFNVCKNSAGNEDTFAHECGHNMGCGHHREQDSPGPGRFDYSAGWRWTSGVTQWRSIMAYAPGTRAQHYSNPRAQHNGIRTGTATADNAETLRVSMAQVENYREASEISVFPTNRTFPASWASSSVTVSSNTSWNWSDNATWLTSNEPTTQNGNQAFSYSIAANTSTQARTATITLTAGNLTRTHTVSQAGIEISLTVSPATRSIAVAATGGNGTFEVISNTSWSWSDNADWLTSNEPTSQSGNQTFSYSVAANTSTQSRTATITITAGNLTRTHTVSQTGVVVGLVVNEDLGTLGAGSIDLVGDTGAGADNAQAYTAAGAAAGGWAGNEWIYQFSIDQDLIVTITSNSVVGDPDAFLLNSLETVDNGGSQDATGALARAFLDGTPPETISFGLLPAGTYYLSVDAWGTGVSALFDFTLNLSEWVEGSLVVSPDTRSIAVAATGGNGTFEVISNTSWSWSDNADWLTSNEPTSQSGNQTFSYSVAANTSTQSRTATITITAGNLTRTHTVSQTGVVVGLVVNEDLGTLGAGPIDLVGDTGAGADNAQAYTAAGAAAGGWASNEWIYQFSIDQDLIVTITSNSVVGDPDAFLLNSLETVDNGGSQDATGALARAFLDGTPPETISFGLLPAGTYYLSVDAWGTGVSALFDFTLDLSEWVGSIAISVNIAGGNANSPSGGGGGGEGIVTGTAGLGQLGNWNNAIGASNVGAGLTVPALVNSTGAATGASFSWVTNNTWSTSTADGQGGDVDMMSGYIDNFHANGSINVAGLGPEFTGPGYTVLVYYNTDNSGMTAGFTVADNAGNTDTRYGHQLVANANYPLAGGTDGYIISTETANNTLFSANIVQLNGFSGSEFTMTGDAGTVGSARARPNGIQIVALVAGSDSDGDGLPNAWEIQYNLDPNDNGDVDPDNGAAGDPDADTLSNLEEFNRGTDPGNADSDSDGFSDGLEVAENSDPNATHSYPTRVLTVSTPDNGTVTGGGTYPLGTVATLEASPALGYLFTGWTGDGSGSDNPLSLTMNVNRTVGPVFEPDQRDPDGDGLSNYQELVIYETDPDNADSDDDGSSDGDEATLGTNPLDSDSDDDGLADGVESNTGIFNSPTDTGTDPLLADSDGDNFSDGDELNEGTDPTDVNDFPGPLPGNTHSPGSILFKRTDGLNVGDPNDQFTGALPENTDTALPFGVLDDPDSSIITQINVDTEGGAPTHGIDLLGDNFDLAFTFQFYDGDGQFSFTENFDDRVQINITPIVSATDLTATGAAGPTHQDTSWNTRTYGDYNFGGGGWFDAEIIMTEDGGGAQSAGGIGFGYSNAASTGTEGDYGLIGDGAVFDIDGNGESFGSLIRRGTQPPSNYTLEIAALSNGSISGGGTYLAGTTATLEASPALGYLFTGWSGDASGASADTYSQNFDTFADGTTDLQDRTTISGAAARIQGGQLMLTEDLRGLGFSSFTVPPLEGSSNGWTATFDLTITDSLGGQVPADGLSLNYGNAAEGELGSAEEGMGAIGSVTENLSFEIDTWMNFDTEQGVNIAEKVDGIDNDLAFTNGPILDDGTSVGGAVTVSWNPVDGASFSTTGLLTNADFSNVATSFVPDDSHTFIFSARVGGANQDLFIDNLVITTGWTGDGSGRDNPLTLVMDGNRTVGATFEQDQRDPDGDGLSNYQELVVHGTDPDNADSDGDGFDDGLEISENTDPNAAQDYPMPQYALIREWHTWEGAREDAGQRGGRLAVIDTPEKQDLIETLVEQWGGPEVWDTDSIWIGLSDLDGDGTWNWVDGSPLSWTNWSPSAQPPGTQDGIVAYNTDLHWIDSLGTWGGNPVTKYYIIEYPSNEELTLEDGLVAYYPFNGNVNDGSENSNDGNPENIVYVPSEVGNGGSAAFLGSQPGQLAGALVPSDESLRMPATGHSISGWVKSPDFSVATPSNSYFTLVASQGMPHDGAARHQAWSLLYGGHGISMQATGGDNAQGGYVHIKFSTTDPATTFLENDKWHHMVVTYDGSKFSGYINGSPMTVWGDPNVENLTPKFTGRDTGIGMVANRRVDQWLPVNNGYIDEIRIYNRGLSAEEVTELYELDKPVQSTSTFEIVEGNFSWEEALADAEARGGRLAVLDTPAQNSAAYSYLDGVGTWPFLWLGASDAETEDVWVWLNGATLEDSNPRWKGGEGPTNNNNPDAEDYLVMFSSDSGTNAGLWGDAGNQQAYLLETGFAQDLNDGLVAYYPFNGNANDESGNDNDGTVNGATLVTDRHGNADSSYDFDGASDTTITAPDQDYLNFADGDMTLSVWFKFTGGAQSNTMIGQSPSAGPAKKWIIYYNEPDKKFYYAIFDHGIGPAYWLAGTDFVDDGQWHQLIYTKEGSDYSSYLDGEYVTTQEGPAVFPNPDTSFRIGYAPDPHSMRGGVDDVRLYNRALSEEEVSALYDLENTPATYTLEIAATSNGSVDGAGTYSAGTEATVTASPDLGYLFTGWTGDASGIDNPLALVMGANQTVGATFEQDTRDPDGDGLSNYQELVIYETDPGNADSDSDGFNDGLEISENTDPNAAQSYPTRVLTVSTPDNGAVTGDGTYRFGSGATLEASPALGYLFTGWTGDGSGSDNPLSLTMNVNRTVGAIFEPDAGDPDQDGLSNYQELVVHGTDPDNADSDGDGFDDGLEISENTDPNATQEYPTRVLTVDNTSNGSVAGAGIYQLGTGAVLTANPALGYFFTAWTGDAAGNNNPLALVMYENQAVGAVFGQDQRDPDGDGLSNWAELVLHGTDPNDPDSDGDGFDDKLEISENTDPNAAQDYPIRVLTVSTPDNGTVTGGGTYGLGTVATLEASPALGYLFTDWSGDASGSDNPLALVMDGNQAVGATFAQDARDPDQDGLSNYQELVLHGTDPDNADSDGDGFNDGVEVAESTNPNAAQEYPTRILTISNTSNGTVTGAGTYPLGTDATVGASPALGYLFTGWTGDGSGSDNPLSLTMNVNRTVGPVFEPDQRDPDGDGLSNYQELVIYETDPGNADSDSDGFNDGLEISENTDPNAAQSYPTRVLTVSTPDNGAVTGDGTYRFGSGATLEASPALGYLFTGWTGDGSGSDNPLSLTMNVNRTVGAIFEPDAGDPDQDGLSNYQELVVHGTDPDNADSDGDGFDDGLEISENTDPNATQEYPTRVLTVDNTSNGSVAGAGIYQLGTGAVLTANPALGYFFTAWTGDAAGNNNPLALVMYENQAVGAVFGQDQRDPDGDGLSNWAELVLHGTDPNDPDSDGDGFDDKLEISENTDPNAAQDYPIRVLTVSTPDNGTVTGGGTYGLGTVATLEASPALGYLFTDWSGDASGSDNPLALVMDGNQAVGATFAQDARDPDQDGLSNYQELVLHGTDPDNADSDGDGFNDGLEISENSDPNAAQDYPIRVLTVSTPDNGTVTGGGTYRLGRGAALEAIPAPGYVFTAWTGDASGNNNPLALIMYENQSVGAIFEPDAGDLDQDGLSNWAELVLHGTDPNDPDSDGDGFDDKLEISENTDPTDPQSYPTRVLTVTNPANGTVTGGGTYPLGTDATLEAIPAPGYVFTSWTGDGTGTDNPLALVMDGNQTVGAIFTQESPDPGARLVNVTFNEDLTTASLFLKGLTQGQVYHVTGTVDGEDFFRFSESEFTADTSGLVVLPVNVAFRPYGVLLKVVEGPIPAQDP